MLAIIARRYAWLLAGLALLAALSQLAPDNALAQLRQRGVLTACLPVSKPPLVTGDAAHPGLEVEVLSAIAADLGVRLSVNRIAAMGQDFDPSRWRITRAQCAVIGDGLVDSARVRSFLDVTPPYLQTGLVALSPAPRGLAGARVAGLIDIPGLDRLALSRLLRDEGAEVTLLRNPAALLHALHSGAADLAIMDGLGGRALAEAEGLTVTALPPPFDGRSLVFGLWRGELTLKRALHRIMDRMQADGRLRAIQGAYAGG